MTEIPPSENVTCCNCTEGNCCSLTCPCFHKGCICSRCQCQKCQNNSLSNPIRLAEIEKAAIIDPLAFTAEDTITQDEKAAMRSFAMLTSSVDDEEIQVKIRENTLSRLLIPEVLNQSIRTIISAANEDLKKADPETIQEKAENSVASEFENVLRIIADRIKPAE